MWLFRIFNTLWAALPVVLVLAALRPLSARSLRDFGVRYGLDLTDDSLPALPRELGRTRVFALIGAAIGLSAHPILTLVGVEVPSLGALFGLTGYLVGQVLAAVTGQPSTAGPRRASLFPRRASDYFSRRALVTPAAATGLGLVALVVYAIEPRRLQPGFTGSALAIVPTVLASAVAYAAIHVVVARRQPVTTPGLVALDNALRAQCVHTAAAIGGTVALIGAGSCLIQMGGYAAAEWLHLAGGIAGLVAIVLGLMAWGYRTTAWQVHRAVTA